MELEFTYCHVQCTLDQLLKACFQQYKKIKKNVRLHGVKCNKNKGYGKHRSITKRLLKLINFFEHTSNHKWLKTFFQARLANVFE